MKRAFTCLFAVIFISSSFFAQNYGLGNTAPSIFTKFRLPETNLHSLYFDTNFKFARTSANTQQQSSTYESKQVNSDISYSLAPHYYLLMENEKREFSLDAYIDGGIAGDKSESTRSYSYDQETKTTSYDLTVDIAADYKNYFAENDLFYSVSSDMYLSIDDQRYKYYYDGELSEEVYDSYKRQRYIAGLGFGLGEIRQVTPIVSALRFQERLKQLNLTDNDLSEQSILDLAQQFYKKDYYSTVHDRPSKYFWDDVEKILNKDGVSLDGINQYGSSYLRETTEELRFARREGFIVGSEIQLYYENYYYYGSLRESLFLLANLYAEYSHQLNLASQIHASFSFSGGPNITEDPQYKQKYLTSTEIGYDYEITDRLVTSISNIFDLSFWNSGTQVKYIDDYLNLALNYFIEDNLSLNTTLSWEYDKNKYPAYTYKASDLYINAGFTYYFDRGFLHR